MNVLVANTYVSPGAGGQERVALDLALGLHQIGHHVVILGPYSRCQSLRRRIPPEIEVCEAPWRAIRNGGRETHWQLFLAARRLIHKHSIQVVSGHGRMFGIYGACRMTGIPLVWTAHGAGESSYSRNAVLKPAAIRAALRHMVKDRRVCVVGVSEFTSKRFLSLVHPSRPHKLTTILNGISTLPALLTLPESGFQGPLRIGYVGRLEAIKGVADLPVVLAGLRNRGIPCTMHVFGDGSQELKLREAFALMGLHPPIVEFRGFEPDLSSIYSQLDVLVHLCPEDWLPSTIIESSAAGRPVIAYGGGGVPEIIENGETGIVCQPGSTRELVDRLQAACKNRELLRLLAARAKASMASRFTQQRMVRDYVRLFTRMLSKEEPRGRGAT